MSTPRLFEFVLLHISLLLLVKSKVLFVRDDLRKTYIHLVGIGRSRTCTFFFFFFILIFWSILKHFKTSVGDITGSKRDAGKLIGLQAESEWQQLFTSFSAWLCKEHDFCSIDAIQIRDQLLTWWLAWLTKDHGMFYRNNNLQRCPTMKLFSIQVGKRTCVCHHLFHSYLLINLNQSHTFIKVIIMFGV